MGSHREVKRLLVLLCSAAILAAAQNSGKPWLDKSLTADQRADLLIKEMTLDEKIQLLHGAATNFGMSQPAKSLGGAGFIPGVERLGIPDIQMADASYGVTKGAKYGRYSTALPSDIAAASTWDAKLAYEYGAVIGRELRAHGFTMSLGGGVNITREPRNGRNFEYLGEDPVLAGKTVGQILQGLQAQHILGDIKHYAVNDQETGRNSVNAIIDKRVMRESDLLAFEIGIKEGQPASVMCSYNRVNGAFACENPYLLHDVLKTSWNFKGWVISDWLATHSTTKAVLAGLDQEMPGGDFLGAPLKKAVESGEVPVARLNDMVHRILRSEIAVGLFDNPPKPQPVDVAAGADVAQRVAERGSVLLKNSGVLPLNASTIKSIAVIGSHADVGVISGGGSAQVEPLGGNPVPLSPAPPGYKPNVAELFFGRGATYFPSAPLKAIRMKVPSAKVEYDAGINLDAAAALAKSSEVAIVFVHQPSTEAVDHSLTLPNNQDALVAAVAAANPRTIVVLETGGPALMPWIGSVAGAMEVWFPGTRGGEAIANLLFGDVNPSGKLAVTFPKSVDDLPHPRIAEPPAKEPKPGENPIAAALNPGPFDMEYSEGLKVGYKWYDAEGKEPLFPFGHGLSYTTFAYSGLQHAGGKVTFTVKNTGKRAGIETAQVYAGLPSSTGEPPKRLVAWENVHLGPGESKTVTLTLDPWLLSIFDVQKNDWQLPKGEFKLFVGGSSRQTPLTVAFTK